MIARLGLYQTIAIVAVALGIGGWAVYTQTDLFGGDDAPVPAVVASDDPVAVKQEDEPAQEDDVAEAETVEADVASETESVAEEATAAEETEVAQEEVVEEPVVEEPVIPAPTFDVVRVESDGTTVVAGSGPAGWNITILVDGVEVVTVPADASGQFVAFLDLGKSDQARVMTLRATGDQRIILSDAQVIIAPVTTRVAEEETLEVEADVEVASAETEETADTTDQPQAVQEQDTATEEAVVEETEVASVSAEQEETEEAPESTETIEEVSDASDATEDESAETTEQEAVVAEATEPATEAEAITPTVSTSDTEGAVETDTQTVDAEPAVAEAAEQDAETAVAVAAEEDAETTVAEATGEEADTAVAEATGEEADTAEVAVTEEKAATSAAEDTAAVATEDDTAEAPAQEAAPAVLLVDDSGVNVLQPADASPEALAQLSIAAITYAEDGAVFLTGFSPAGFLRVYINNKQVVVLEIPEPGEWKAELVDVAPGVYTLRVDQVDADGKVVQRVETPFKREEPEKVVAVAQTRKPLVSLEVVQPGSTLWAISREAYGSGVLFVRIFEANRDQIRNPDLIYPGQIFELPAPPGAKKKKRTSG